MSPGIYPGIDRAAYDAIKAINISTLIHGTRSMAHLREAMLHPEEPTRAMLVGQAVHVSVFEPERLETLVAVRPKFTGTGSRAAADQWAEAHAGQIVVDGPDYATDESAKIGAIRDACRRRPDLKAMLEAQGKGEISFVWQDEKTGLICKGRLDRYCTLYGDSIVLDLKTCRDASLHAFSRDVASLHYYVKAAWYLDGLNSLAPAARRFVWIAAESLPPYEIALYEPNDEMLAEGARVWRRLLDAYAACLASGNWPGYQPYGGIEPLALPRWATTETRLEA